LIKKAEKIDLTLHISLLRYLQSSSFLTSDMKVLQIEVMQNLIYNENLTNFRL